MTNPYETNIFIYLIKQGDTPMAAQNDDLEYILTQIEEQQAEYNKHNEHDEDNKDNKENEDNQNLENELFVATKEGNSDKISQLIAEGVNVDCKATFEVLQMHFTKYSGRFNVDSLSLESTPLMVAAKYGQHEALVLLITSGANVNAVNRNKQTALMFAAGQGNPENVRALIAMKADIHAVSEIPNNYDERYTTALHLAAKHYHVEAVEILLEALYADPDVKSLSEKIQKIKAEIWSSQRALDDPKLQLQPLVLDRLEKSITDHQQELSLLQTTLSKKLKVLNMLDEIAPNVDLNTPFEYGKPDGATPLGHRVKEQNYNPISKEERQQQMVVYSAEQEAKHEQDRKANKEHMEPYFKRGRQITRLLLSARANIENMCFNDERAQKTSKNLNTAFLSELHKRTEIAFFKETQKPFIVNYADLRKFKAIRAKIGSSVAVFLEKCEVDTTLPKRYAAIREFFEDPNIAVPRGAVAVVLEYYRNTLNPDFQGEYAELHQKRLLVPLYKSVQYKDASQTGKLNNVTESALSLIPQGIKNTVASIAKALW